MSQVDALIAADRAHVWHPYASMLHPGTAHVVESARGVRLRLADGREVVDGMASWWSAIHGYRHPVLDAAAADQLSRMSHVMFGGLTHEPAVRLAETLVRITPERLQHVFFADSGSVSVEVALKLALQWQHARGATRRTRLLTIRGGYHGDTFLAMSVCDPVNGMHTMFDGVLPQQVFAPQPPAGFDADITAWAAETRALAAEHAHELAAIIVEPVLQGAGGMHVYSPACLQVLREVADEHGLLLVLDEIATGFGRTGTLFASEHAGISPDIVCLGKALTGGYLTLAAVLCTTAVAEGIPDGLMHGPTFMANPLACAVAGASVDLLLDSDWATRVATMAKLLADGLSPLADAPGVADVRVIGGAGVVQTSRPVDAAAVAAVALREGVWLRPFRDLVYTLPPYACTDDDLQLITAAIRTAVTEVVR